MAEEVVAGSEGAVAEGGSGARIFGIIALVIYFIWGQSFACAWWMYIILGGLSYLVVTNSAKMIQLILGLFLIGITFFAPPTFGYDEDQKSEYMAGFKDAQYDLLYPNVDIAWEEKQDRASIDINKWKKFYYRGFKRGRAGKEE